MLSSLHRLLQEEETPSRWNCLPNTCTQHYVHIQIFANWNVIHLLELVVYNFIICIILRVCMYSRYLNSELNHTFLAFVRSWAPAVFGYTIRMALKINCNAWTRFSNHLLGGFDWSSLPMSTWFQQEFPVVNPNLISPWETTFRLKIIHTQSNPLKLKVTQ